jgi:hypothetical protein
MRYLSVLPLRRSFIALILLGGFFASVAFSEAAGPKRPFHVGLWAGGAYTNDQTGAFSHCAAAVPYKAA